MNGYHLHWLSMRKRISKPPAIFHVNWFRKDAQGNFLWPGFGENMRVLAWIVDRLRGGVGANETAIGWTPSYDDLEWRGLDFTRQQFEEVQKIDPAEWATELHSQDELFVQLHDRL